MSVDTFHIGDTAECPKCGKEFEINGDDDFDDYFYHVTTCGPSEDDYEVWLDRKRKSK